MFARTHISVNVNMHFVFPEKHIKQWRMGRDPVNISQFIGPSAKSHFSHYTTFCVL